MARTTWTFRDDLFRNYPEYLEPLPAATVRGYTAVQKPATSVPAIGINASISIADPSSVNQLASILCNSMVSR